MSQHAPTAAATARVSCAACDKLCDAQALLSGSIQKCPRCGARLRARKTNSIHRTWALVITGMILYIPANVYPVMTFTSFGRGRPDTIISGVVELFESGYWMIGILIFAASIFIPLLKLLGLSFLLLSVQFKWHWRPRQRALMYRSIEKIGRWSMLDVFLVSMLTALVKLGLFAEVIPEKGCTAFAAVVIITMFAAMSFDPRLIWDNENQKAEARPTVLLSTNPVKEGIT